MIYVVDSSVYAPLVALYGRNLIKAMKKVKIVILDLTVYESCNAFWKECVKLHRISDEEAIKACEACKALSKYVNVYKIIDLDARNIIEIAISNNITFYDSSYIALAQKLKASIVSEDKDIIDIAPKYSLEVIRLHEFLRILQA